MADERARKLTPADLRRKRDKGETLVAVTAYDALMGRLVDECGVDLVLVGDSLGMTVLGYRNTIPVTLEQSLHHTAAVVRGVQRAVVVGDMPFMTYQISEEQALRNAARYLQEAGADAVKIEGGEWMAPVVRRLVRAGVPVLGHIGLLPQSIKVEGRYRVHGKKPEEAEALMRDAQAIQEAGAFAIVLEGLPMDLAGAITKSLFIPTIGIGAGPYCSGQIQVLHDILGLFEEFVPRHTRRYAHLADAVRQAVSEYARDVRNRDFPTEEHSFR